MQTIQRLPKKDASEIRSFGPSSCIEERGFRACRQAANWNTCSCKLRTRGWQSAQMLSKDFADFFGHIVRKHRKARFLTQEQLAERADLAPKMISLIERRQRNPSLNVADSIARGLSVPCWRLIKDTEDLRQETETAKRKK